MLLGREIENEILADFPITFDAVCAVMTTSATVGPYSQDRHHGRSAQIVSSGVDPSNLDLRRRAAVGAPGAETDDVVGEVVLTAASTLTGEINPTDPDNLVLHPHSASNFYNVDSVQNTTSAAARHMEVAIGRPGAYNDQGVVNIFSTGLSGVDPFSTASNIEEYVGATADARFGESIDAGYVQQTHWQDLLMGAPSHPNSSFADGTASLSQAKEVSTCVELDGTWVAPDDTGYLVGFQITNNEALDTLTVTFLETFVVSLYEDYGLSTERVCQQDWDGEVADATFYLPPGLTLELPEAYDCTGSGKTWTDIEMDDLILALTGYSLPVKMDVAFVATGSGQIQFSLTPNGTTFPYLLELAGIDDSEACQIEPLPLTMTRITTGLCE